MRSLSLLWMVGVLLALVPYTSAQQICSGSLSSRLAVGHTARVTSGVPNNLRSSPENGAIIGKIPGLGEFEILGGPVCGAANGLTWWNVRYNGQEGWTAEGDTQEYWLELVSVPQMTCNDLLLRFNPQQLLSVLEQCVQQADAPELAAQSAALGLLLYFNQGGTPEAFSEMLPSDYLLGPFQRVNWVTSALHPQPASYIDLDNDGLLDVVVLLNIDDYAMMNLSGGLLVALLRQSDGTFAPAYYERLNDGETMGGGVEIVALGRLNDDHHIDLITASTGCGAHTCWSGLRFRTWMNGAFTISDQPRDSVQGYFASENRHYALPYPDFYIEGQGSSNVIVELRGGGIGSVGAGPTPPENLIWHYDPDQQVWLWHAENPPSPYRIHALVRADEAAVNEDYAAATQLYKQVLFDQALDDMMLFYPETIAAYAYFRTGLLQLVQGDVTATSQLIKETGQRFADSEQHIFYEMSVLLLNKYTSEGLGAACAAVQSYISQSNTFPYEAFDWGYANPSYDAETICPFGF